MQYSDTLTESLIIFHLNTKLQDDRGICTKIIFKLSLYLFGGIPFWVGSIEPNITVHIALF